MTICTRVARNGLSYSGSTERASRPRCVQTFLMATRNRAPVLFPLSSPFFPFLFSFYLSRYDHLVTTLLNERSSRILPSSRPIKIGANARAMNVQSTVFSRVENTHDTNDEMETKVRTLLPIFRASSSKEILQPYFVNR